jgi:hypothetical protein
MKFKFDDLLKSYSWISIFLLLIPAFINFDSHHDGLVLSTALELRKALENGSAWPFNQYGQLWAFPYALLSFVVSDQYLLVSMRLLTFLYYLATAGLIYKVSGRFLSGPKVKVPVLLFLLAQPFALGLNSTFLPWPSALCVLLITLVLERLTVDSKSIFLKQSSYLFTGVLILGIWSTRLQVGILILLSLFLLLILHKKLKLAMYLLAGFTISLACAGIYMHTKGWLRDSLFDTLVFASQYISGDTSMYPLPRMTLLLTFLFLMIIIAFDLTLQKRILWTRLSLKTLRTSGVLFFISIFCFSIFGSLVFSNFVALLIRRTWISITMAFFIYAVVTIAVDTVRKKRLFSEELFRRNVLLLLSLCSFTQILPLFDQMHFWWGYSPLVIFLVYFIDIRFLQSEKFRLPTRLSLSLVLSLLLLINVFGVSRQIGSVTEPMNTNIGLGIYLNDATDNRISEFLNKNIEEKSTILSLCPNSNAIFSIKSSRSAIREFVLWSPTFDFQAYKRNFQTAKYDYIVTCPLPNTEDVNHLKVNDSISQVLRGLELVKVGSYTVINNRVWVIYKSAG